MERRRGFTSDNAAGAHPAVLRAISEANSGHAAAYGADPFTESAALKFKEHFGDQAEVYFVFNGTAANVLCLAAATEPHHAVICAESSHVNVDECGATERFRGCKLLPVPAPAGKIALDSIRSRLIRLGDQHHSQPRVVTLAQPTEYGTLYSLAELREIAELCHRHDLLLHVDGARLANAAAALDVSLRGLTTDVGVDMLSFGGTKNGLLFGDAVVFLRPSLTRFFPYVRKQGLQLASKMRFIAAQFEALLSDGLWLRNASHANGLARRLADGAASVSHVQITQTVAVNSVFARLPAPCITPLQARFPFYLWDELTSEVRWMTAWDTTTQDVDEFLEALRVAAP